MNPTREEKDTLALRIALAEELYALENERLIFFKKYKIERAILVSLFLLFLGALFFYQFMIKKNVILNSFVPIFLFGLIAGGGIYAWLQKHFVRYSKKVKPIVLQALCQVSGEQLTYGGAPDNRIQNMIEDALRAWSKAKRAGRVIQNIEFDDTFKGQKQGGWTIAFGDLHFKVGTDNSEEVHENYHLLKMPEGKKINQNRLEAFKLQLSGFFWVTYDEKYQTLLILMEQTKKQKQAMDFELSLKDSLRESKTLAKIQQAFYTNLNSFEDLMALFD